MKPMMERMRSSALIGLVLLCGGCGADDGSGPDVSSETISTPRTVAGPDTVFPDGVLRAYTTGDAKSSLGHQVAYRFDWGDGSTSSWGAPQREYAWFPSGLPHDYTVRAQARCVEHPTASSAWSQPFTITVQQVMETVPPNTMITACPEGEIGYSTVVIEWEGVDNVSPKGMLEFSQFIEGLDADWGPFTKDLSRRIDNLTDGSYTFYVKARDEAGNEDPTPATRSFDVKLPATCSVTVSHPAVGEVWADSTVQTIEWNLSGVATGVDIELFHNGAYSGTIATGEVNDGAYEWLVDDFAVTWSDAFEIKVYNADDRTCFASGGLFTIDVPIYVTQVYLYMPIAPDSWWDSGGLCVARAALGGWSENTITWNNQPGWGSVHAGLSTRIQRSEATDIEKIPVDSGMVTRWLWGTQTNYGVAITDLTPDAYPGMPTYVEMAQRTSVDDPPWVEITWSYAGGPVQTMTTVFTRSKGVDSDNPDFAARALPSGWWYSVRRAASYVKFDVELP